MMGHAIVFVLVATQPLDTPYPHRIQFGAGVPLGAKLVPGAAPFRGFKKIGDRAKGVVAWEGKARHRLGGRVEVETRAGYVTQISHHIPVKGSHPIERCHALRTRYLALIAQQMPGLRNARVADDAIARQLSGPFYQPLDVITLEEGAGNDLRKIGLHCSIPSAGKGGPPDRLVVTYFLDGRSFGAIEKMRSAAPSPG